MINPANLGNLPTPVGTFATVFLSLLAVVTSPFLVPLHDHLEWQHISHVEIKAGHLSHFQFGKEEFDACEIYWRNELKWHLIDKTHDRLYGIANVRLADVLCRKSRYYGLPIPAELEALYIEGLKVEEALDEEPGHLANAAEALANFYQLRKRYVDSENILKTKLASLKNPYAHRGMEIITQLGDQYIEQKRYQEAVTLWTETFSKRKKFAAFKWEDPFYLCELARAYHGMGDYSHVIAICEKALRYGNSANTQLRPYLANALHKLGRDEEAISHYSRDLKFERERRGWTRIGDKFVMSATPLPDTQTGAGSDLFALGEIYFEQRQYAKAEPLLVEALDIGNRKLKEEQPAFVRESETEWVAKVQHTLEKLHKCQGRASNTKF